MISDDKVTGNLSLSVFHDITDSIYGNKNDFE